MSGHGAPTLSTDAAGLRVAVVAASWHEQVMNGLIDGARRGLADAGVRDDDVTLVRVPGTFELTAACAPLNASPEKPSASAVSPPKILVAAASTPKSTPVPPRVANAASSVSSSPSSSPSDVSAIVAPAPANRLATSPAMICPDCSSPAAGSCRR